MTETNKQQGKNTRRSGWGREGDSSLPWSPWWQTVGDVRGGSSPAVTDSRGDKGKGSNAANMIQNTIITKILQVPKLKRFF